MMKVLPNVWQAQRPLIMAGVGFMLAASVLALLMQFDSSQITGVTRWLKPLKFSLSAGIFLLTVAVYLFFLPGYEALKSIILYGLILIMAGEVSLITMQAARGKLARDAPPVAKIIHDRFKRGMTFQIQTCGSFVATVTTGVIGREKRANGLIELVHEFSVGGFTRST